MSARKDVIKIVWTAIWAGLQVAYMGDPSTELIQVSGKPNYVYVSPQVGAREGVVEAFNPFGVRCNQLYLPVRVLTADDGKTKIVVCVDPVYALRFASGLNILRSNLDIRNDYNSAVSYGTTEIDVRVNSAAWVESAGIVDLDLSVSAKWDGLAAPGDTSTITAPDLEFESGSGVPSGYTEFDPPTILSPDREAATNTYVLNPTASSVTQGYVGIYTALAATSRYFETQVAISSIVGGGTNIQRAGLAYWDDVTDTATGAMRVLSLGRNTDGGIIQIMAESLTNYNAAPTVLASQEWHQTSAYLRIAWDQATNDLYYLYSSDGLGWQQFYTETLAFTPSQAGIVASRYKGVYARFRHVRSGTGDPASYAQSRAQVRYI